VTRAAPWLVSSILWLGGFGALPAMVEAQEDGEEAATEHQGEPEAAHHEVGLQDVIEPAQFLSAVVNFCLLIGIFVLLGRKPLRGFLSNRKRTMEEGLAEAQRMTAEAEAKYDEYSKRLEQLDREIDQIRAEMVRAGEAERDRIVAEAEAKGARMRRDADFLIQQQMKQLKVDLTREAVRAAVEAAEELLRGKTAPDDQQRLARAYLERLHEKARETRDGGGTP
jgi:F-type H+-transporting ATPase subunit b